jgi:hypothetical protein
MNPGQSQSQSQSHRKTLRRTTNPLENQRVAITPLKIMEVYEPETDYVSVKAEDYSFASELIFGGETSKDFGNDPMMESMSVSFEKKPWNRLDMSIRLKKLEEWISELQKEYPQESMSDTILTLHEELQRRIRSGELNKHKYIIYDTESRRITSIPCVVLDIDSCSYSIDLRKKS